MERTLRLSAAPYEVVLLAALAATVIPTMYGTHPGEGLRHWLAAAIAAVAGLSIVAAAAGRRRVELLGAGLATCSAAAATVHFAVIAEHVEEYWLFGVFFVLAGLAQALFAVLVVERPSRLIYLAGALGNAAIIALWAATRTVGLPFGPTPGEAEAVGTADVVSTVLEALIVAGSVAMLTRPLRVAIRRPILAALLLTAGVVTVIALVTVTGTHTHHEHPAGHVDHHD